MYNFLFDRKSLVLLLLGLGVAGGLLFFGGMLLGVQWGLPAEPVRVAAVCPPAGNPTPAKVYVERPCPPAAEPAPLVQEIQETPEPPAPEPEPEPAPTVTAAAYVPQAEEGAFSIQVGAFSRPENLEKAVRDLQSRGYEPYVVDLQRRRGVLRTVRIGRYADPGEAARAASDFRQRERMAAIVQPVDS